MRSRARVLLLLLILTCCAVRAASAEAVVPVSCPHNSDAYSNQVLADAPIAYYRLDEPSGPTMCDSSPSSNNGTYNASGITYGVPGALPASSDTAVSTSPSLTSGNVAQSGSDPASLTGNHAYTLEAWFKYTQIPPPSPYPPNSWLVGLGGTGNTGQAGVMWLATHFNSEFGYGPTTALVIDQYGSAFDWDLSKSPNLWDGNWHYVAVTYTPSTSATRTAYVGYVDGQSLGNPASRPYGNVVTNLAASPIILGHAGGTEPWSSFQGALDEVAVYPSALTASQVDAHWTAASTAATSATLIVSLAGQGTGTVTSTPAGISCPGTCSHTYNAGSNVALTATPTYGSTFAGWSGACTGIGPCQLTMNSPQSVTANFLPAAVAPVSPPSPAFSVNHSISTPVKLASGYRGIPVTTDGACELSVRETSVGFRSAEIAKTHHKKKRKKGLVKTFKMAVLTGGKHFLPLIPTRKEIKLWRKHHHHKKKGALIAAAPGDLLSVNCTPLNFSNPTGTQTPIPPNNSHSVQIGGLDLDGYCRSIGFSHSQHNGPFIGPNSASDWVCVSASGQQAFIDLQAACRHQYPGLAVFWQASDPTNAFNGQCYALGTPTGGGTTTTVTAPPPPPPAPPLCRSFNGSNASGSISLSVCHNQVTSLSANVTTGGCFTVTASGTSTGPFSGSGSIPGPIPLSTSGSFGFNFPGAHTFNGHGQVTASGGSAGVGIGAGPSPAGLPGSFTNCSASDTFALH